MAKKKVTKKKVNGQPAANSVEIPKLEYEIVEGSLQSYLSMVDDGGGASNIALHKIYRTGISRDQIDPENVKSFVAIFIENGDPAVYVFDDHSDAQDFFDFVNENAF